MLSYFKNQQPATLFAFLLFFIVLKLPLLLYGHFVPMAPVENLWGSVGLLLSESVFLNFLLAQVCLLLQAIAFNFLFHKANYHEGSSMVPAIYFVLVTSLLPEFNQFSIYLLIGFILLWMFQTLLIITIKENSKMECFNLGFIGGLLILLHAHFILFLPFLFFMLFVIKPFRFNEYLMMVFGILCPVYLALALTYLADIYVNIGAFAPAKFHFFRFEKNIFNAILLILTACYLFFSFISMRGILYSTGFKRKKNIRMLIFFFLGIAVVILFSANLGEPSFSLLFIPISIFLSLFMLRIRKKRLGEILNAIFVVAILVINIVRILK